MLDVSRMTLYRWTLAGLPRRKEPGLRGACYYRVNDLRAMKRRMTSRQIAVPKIDDDLFDYG